ncbi:class I SAM-dependent methyltransferase [Fodinicola feengrottensis]|uniref:class I SAM-dependent methyltransferase n=1 Tax=Fodinicola feengrottensis TaxID=435914 RepID=UPI002442FA03|nr:class I SAM-dependent methyltransferase [Fodinicola feengrottensis]
MPRLVRNNLAVYDDLADRWWDPRGPFAGLGWLAASRAEQIRPAANGSSVLVDIACGGGLLQPYAAGKGYVHIGVDLSPRSLQVARSHGVRAIRADMNQLPLADECAEVVVAGECLEHVPDPYQVVAECCRILKPGGVLIVDTAANTVLARVLGITLLKKRTLSRHATARHPRPPALRRPPPPHPYLRPPWRHHAPHRSAPPSPGPSAFPAAPPARGQTRPDGLDRPAVPRRRNQGRHPTFAGALTPGVALKRPISR